MLNNVPINPLSEEKPFLYKIITIAIKIAKIKGNAAIGLLKNFFREKSQAL